MGRKRKTEEEKKISISISLPGWMVNQIDKMGSRSKVIEKILSRDIKRDNRENHK